MKNYKALIIKIVLYWQTDGKVTMEQSPEISIHIYGQLDFLKLKYILQY